MNYKEQRKRVEFLEDVGYFSTGSLERQGAEEQMAVILVLKRPL